MKLFQLLLLGSVFIPSSSYSMFEEELTDVIYKHWNPGTLPLEKDKNTINFLDVEKNKEEMNSQETTNNNSNIKQKNNLSNDMNDNTISNQNDKLSLVLFKRGTEDKIDWKTEKKLLANKIYQYWEDKKDISANSVICTTTACSILNAEYNSDNINYEQRFLYSIYSSFVEVWDSHIDFSERAGSKKIDYFLRGLIRHLYDIGELDNKRYLENEYKEKAQEIISNHAYTYASMGSQEGLSSDIKPLLGQEGTISSKKSKKIKVQQEKNTVFVSENNK